LASGSAPVAAGTEAQDDWLPRTIRCAKPYGGLFHLSADSGAGDGKAPIKNILGMRFKEGQKKIYENLTETSNKKGRKPPTAHSAPYACTLVADRLLKRARALRGTAGTDTPGWVQVALLAEEAKEILGGLSRTVGYEALAVQNEAEARAEV